MDSEISNVDEINSVYKTKLRIELGGALVGALIGFALTRHSNDVTDRVLSIITSSLFFYQVGNIFSDIYHLKKL